MTLRRFACTYLDGRDGHTIRTWSFEATDRLHAAALARERAAADGWVNTKVRLLLEPTPWGVGRDRCGGFCVRRIRSDGTREYLRSGLRVLTFASREEARRTAERLQRAGAASPSPRPADAKPLGG